MGDDLFISLIDRLHEGAADVVGHADFGREDYLEGLRVLLAAMDAGPAYSPQGRDQALDLICTTLVGRLHAQAGWKRYPQCLTQPIVRPVVIMGLPRSGTTALHKLMAMDPAFQCYERWLRFNPMPRPMRDTWAKNPYYQAMVAQHAVRVAAAPEAFRAHPVAPDEPDECLAPMAQSFISNYFGSNLDVPEYDTWFMAQDETASYLRYADNLRLVGMNDPDKAWLLKNPSHIMGIEALLKVFPDACVIHTVRHPSATIASLANMMVNLRRPLMGQDVDRDRIIARDINWYGEAVRRAMAAGKRHPDRIVSVDFREIVSAPLAAVRRIYDHFGMEMAPQTEARMREWLAANPQDKHGMHHYRKLDDDAVAEAFADYIRHYDL